MQNMAGNGRSSSFHVKGEVKGHCVQQLQTSEFEKEIRSNYPLNKSVNVSKSMYLGGCNI